MASTLDIIIVNETDNPLSAPSIRYSYEYWRALKGTRRMPSRGEFKPQNIVNYLSLISLIDVVGDGADFRYRLVGTKIDEVTGTNHTGMLLSEIQNKKSREIRFGNYRLCVTEKKPVFNAGSLINYKKEFRYYQTLLMPFSDDGENVNILFAAHDIS